MATIPLIEDADATGKTREVFDDIKATKGIDFVPNIWRSLAIDPEHLESCWRRVKTIMADGALDRRTKEIIAVAVSITTSALMSASPWCWRCDGCRPGSLPSAKPKPGP